MAAPDPGHPGRRFQLSARQARLAQVAVGLVALSALLVWLVLIPWYRTLSARNARNQCRYNISCLASAVESYSADNGGRYPRTLQALTTEKRYLKPIPTCPAAHTDTYTPGFESTSSPDAFTIVCHGENHAPLEPPNRPGDGTRFPHYLQW
jgi:hypothetical protein